MLEVILSKLPGLFTLEASQAVPDSPSTDGAMVSVAGLLSS